MPSFTYTAITKNGQKETASIEAPSLAAAGHLLKEQGLLPVQIQEKGAKSMESIFAGLKSISSVSLAEKISMIENLGIMLKAGISISRGLQILVKQTKNTKMKSILTEVYNSVQSGKGLSESLSAFPSVFPNIFISMIKVGEISGNLEKSLEYLSTQLHREADLKNKVRGAMIYPSVIVAAMLIIAVLMAIFVLPKLTAVFKDFGSQLPASTRAVIAVSDFMEAHAVATILGIIAIIAGFIAAYRTYLGQRYFDFFILHMFIINPIVKKINLARFSRILSSLLKSGIPIVQGLEVSSQSMGNIYYQEILRESAQDVKLGKTLTESLGKNNNLFPVLVVQMLQVGEESGTVEDILGQLAVHYEEQVDATLRDLSSIIEPLLLLVIGSVVGVLALALISPIYNIGQSIG